MESYLDTKRSHCVPFPVSEPPRAKMTCVGREGWRMRGVAVLKEEGRDGGREGRVVVPWDGCSWGNHS